MEEPSAIKSDNVAVALPGGLNKGFSYDMAKNGIGQVIPPPGLPLSSGPTTASIASSSGSAPSPQPTISHKIDSLMGSGTSSSATPSSAIDPQMYHQQMMYQQQQRMYAQFNQQQQQQQQQVPPAGMSPQMQQMMQQQMNSKGQFMNGEATSDREEDLLSRS